MKAKEKAKELVKKYLLKIKIDSRVIEEPEVITSKFEIRIETAKHCALIAVDELIEEAAYFSDGYYCRESYWEEVKQEIEKL